MDDTASPRRYLIFEAKRLVAEGGIETVIASAADAKRRKARIAIFDQATGRQILTPEEAQAHSAAAPRPEVRGPGRPKLGVVAREVTLLPRHWDWLAAQPGGASVALRKLVEAARSDASGEEAKRNARNAADRFMLGMAGDAPGFEEASRALYRGDRKAFEANIRDWPEDVRKTASRLAAPAFAKD